ncbi:PREDICTED: uncharacterized protein LOC108358273 [Rhagoletis zephyria]|uniref:uncharacterized protein LOC108358273 n=1 Tax=Rhagoletis zephyria TaxID=28612 RepID=UPI0008118227|nr:PREDICTED: uncharacterized protein LOC108358273 [Rhagoletis zephyria]
MLRSPQDKGDGDRLGRSLIDIEDPCEVSQDNIRNPYDRSEICATSVKLPQFWSNCPEAWFVHAEMQFATKGISRDSTKYEFVITALPQEVIANVLDVIQKKVLIDRHSLSEQRRLDKILSDTEIGDRRPSEYYRTLGQLAGSTIDPIFLKNIWLRKLPKSLYVALTSANLNNINDLLQLADKIWEITSGSEICAVKSKVLTSSNNFDDLGKIVEDLAKVTTKMCESFNRLQLDINEIKTQIYDRPSRSRRRYFSNNKNSQSRSKSQSKNWVCRYHFRFGSKARKCEEPCAFKRNNSDSTN